MSTIKRYQIVYEFKKAHLKASNRRQPILLLEDAIGKLLK